MKRTFLDISRPAPVAAIGPGPAAPAPEVDVVLIFGPEASDYQIPVLTQHCSQNNLSHLVIGDGVEDVDFTKIADLHQSRKLGPHTQAFVIMHGYVADDRHWTLISADEQRKLASSSELIKSLRNVSREVPAAPAWKGLIHLVSCSSGKLRDEIKPGADLWAAGPCLLYAGRTRATSIFESRETMIELLRYFGVCKTQRQPLSPVSILAMVANTGGNCASLIGGDQQQELVVHAPKSLQEASVGWLEAELNQRLTRSALQRNRTSGASRDLERLRLAQAALPGQDAERRRGRIVMALLNRIERGKADHVEKFVRDDPSLLDASFDSGTPLTHSAKRKQQGVVNRLLQLGANVEGRTKEGATALALAAGLGNIGIMQALIDAKAEINARTNERATPLMAACEHGESAAAKFLLDHGAPITSRDINGSTALIIASETGQLDLIQELLARGSEINACNKRQESALACAARFSDHAMMRLLLQNGADPNTGMPILVAASNCDLDATVFLIEAGAEVNFSHFGVTPLSAAITNGGAATIQALIDAGADLTVRNEQGETPLTLACAERQLSAAACLIQADPRLIEAANAVGLTPLMRAAEIDDEAMIRLLVMDGASHEARDPTGRTALIIAVVKGAITAAEALLEAGADVTARDAQFVTPLEAAHRAGRRDIVWLLARYGARV